MLKQSSERQNAVQGIAKKQDRNAVWSDLKADSIKMYK